MARETRFKPWIRQGVQDQQKYAIKEYHWLRN
ncbi:hypothetical protein FOPG_12607 [Fusarium oxysporum f. sp. conglutinans race 2 54008]|uniref:Uncharacterized protein n=1 Tax=Fusarium oxysporum f. sp. conglutinans race 2 54008 TaxID=1089457 RepID=X0IEV5_FUSOX|nr:hypothetical protein FOPG_12607 [Fusarium oxysporum f. sp. conglutinans race 2 54008]